MSSLYDVMAVSIVMSPIVFAILSTLNGDL